MDNSTPLPCHPAYCFDDFDVVLQSSDGLCFKVHKIVLRLGSNFFDRMLQPSTSEDSIERTSLISLEEPAGTIRGVLDILYPDRAAIITPTFSNVLSLLTAAEKYGIKKVTDAVSYFVETKYSNFRINPLENFILACQFGTEHDARCASKQTLIVDLRNEKSLDLLRHLDDYNHLRLVSLHAQRRRLLLEAITINTKSLNNTDNFAMLIRVRNRRILPVFGHQTECVKDFNPPELITLKYFVSIEMEYCSAAPSITSQTFWDRQEFQNLWKIRCYRCEEPVIEKDYFISEVKRLVNLLPDTI